MNVLQKHAALYKLAQVKQAINYVARQRGLFKEAETQEERIRRLKAIRDASSFGSVLAGTLGGAVGGMGLGAGVGATIGGLKGYTHLYRNNPKFNVDGNAVAYRDIKNKDWKQFQSTGLANAAASEGAWKGGVVGSLAGAAMGGINSYLRRLAASEAAKKELAALGIK